MSSGYQQVLDKLLGQGQPQESGQQGPSSTGYEEVLNKLLKPQDGAGYQPERRELPEGFEGQGEAYYGPGLPGYFAGKLARINEKAFKKNPDGTYSEADPNLLQKTSRGIGEGIMTVLDAFALPAKGVKAALGVGLANEVLADSAASPLPDLLQGEQWYNTLLATTPMFQFYNQMRILTGERDISFSERMKEADRQVKASQIMYSAWVDPALRTEFIRRYEEGENPDYLRAELENPWIELAGEMVLDPINIAGFFAKGVTGAKRAAKAAQMATTAIPEAEQAVKAIRAAREGVAIGQAADFTALADRVVEIEKGIKRLDGYISPAQNAIYTATGRRSIMAETVGNTGRIIMGTFQQTPDDAAEAIRALSLIGSGKADEMAEAVAILKNLPVDISSVAFSKAGVETGIVLRKLMTGANGAMDTKILNLVSNADFAKLEQVFNDKLMTTLKGIYPTVDEALEANAKVQESVDMLRKAGRMVEADAKAAELIPISRGAQVVNRINNFARNDLKFKQMHSAMATTYISLQPGVGIRNALSGIIHIGADLGVGAAGKAAGAVAEAGAGFARGKSVEESVGAYKLIRQWLGGSLPDAASRGVGGGLEDATGPIKNLMSAGEQAMSAAIVADVVESTMRKAMRTSFGTLMPEMTRAFGNKGANRLMELVTVNKGDWDKAIVAFRKERATGIIESWRNLREWMNPTEYKKLQGGKILGEVEAAVANADTLEDANRALDNIVKRYTRIAATTADDLPGQVMDEFIQEAADHLPPAELTQFNLKRISYENVRNSFISATDNFLNKAFSQMEQAGDDAGRALVNKMRSDFTNAHIFAGQETAKKTGYMRDLVWKVNDLVDSGNLDDAWRILSQDPQVYGEPWKRALKLPKNRPADSKAFKTLLWDTIFKGESDTLWRMERDNMVELAMSQAKQVADYMGVSLAKEDAFRVAASKLEYSDMVAAAKYIPGKGLIVDDIPMAKGTTEALRSLANRLGIQTANEAGQAMDVRLLNTINANLPEGVEKFAKVEDVPFDVGQKALKDWADKKSPDLFSAASSLGERLPIPRADDSDELFTAGQVAAANLEGVNQAIQRVKSQLKTVWGQGEIVNRMNAVDEEAIANIANIGKKHVLEARLVSTQIASEARDFALINYGKKTTLDLAAAYVMPFQYWYSRTYPNWIKRLATAPDTIAAYAKYRDAIERAHANLPDWWKYNISTNDIPGLELDNPLFFNIEATLNPLNGLTGVDFTDTEKVVGEEGSAMRFWTSSLDAIGKFGPAPHTALTMATALGLYMNGEKDAASRWAGRLIPQTASVKALSAAAGMQPVELDPNVWLFSGGLDPYERRRVGRAMGALIAENPEIEATAIEAMRTQEGPLWDEAYRRSTAERAPATVGSFLFGVGLKPRTPQDMAIDKFYTDYRNLWSQKDNLSPDEFSAATLEIKKQYPFMDAVLLSKKDGIDRDRAYAYTVMNRIPPGQMSNIAKAAGLDPRVLDKFYETKGGFDKWPETDRQRFMAAMVDIGATLDIPADGTRQEWTQVRNEYAAMRREAETLLGAGVWALVDALYDIPTRAGQDDWKRRHPQIQQALDFKAGRVAGSPLLSAYYDGLGQLEKYYEGKFRAEATRAFGDGFWQELSDYYENRDRMPSKEFTAWKKQHPNIARYFDLRDKWDMEINKKLIAFGNRIPEAKSFELRSEAPLSIGAQDITGLYEQQGQPRLTWADVRGDIPLDLEEALREYYASDTPLTYSNRTRLERIAKRLGITIEELLLIAGEGL